MFCPQCGTQNELEQSYCRRCGQSLSGVRLALGGRPEESLEAIKAGQRLIHGGGITLTAFTLIALAVSIVSVFLTGATYNISIILNLLLGLVIGLPLIVVGRARLMRATHLLTNARRESDSLLPEGAPRPTGLLTDTKVDPQLPAQGSVTEDTTQNLKRAERERPKPT